MCHPVQSRVHTGLFAASATQPKIVNRKLTKNAIKNGNVFNNLDKYNKVKHYKSSVHSEMVIMIILMISISTLLIVSSNCRTFLTSNINVILTMHKAKIRGDFRDVTLVNEDNDCCKAHKVNLATPSPLLKNLTQTENIWKITKLAINKQCRSLHGAKACNAITDFPDVTLACRDNVSREAHKVMLAAPGSFLKNKIGHIWLFGYCQIGHKYGHDGYPCKEHTKTNSPVVKWN